MHQITESHEYLSRFSIRPSMQRTAVMNFLMNNRIHPTIDEIYSVLSPDMPTLSKTTIYNTLGLFVEKGAVRAMSIDEKNARFDIDISAHAHFICKSCGALHDIHNLSDDLFQLPLSSEFAIQTVEISYSGICNKCKEQV